MARQRRRRSEGRVSERTQALEATRRAARLTLVEVGRAIGAHPSSVRRWELGVSTPLEQNWPNLLALYAVRAPEATRALAAVTGHPLPASMLADPASPLLAERVVARTADTLDVAPRRVREVLLAAAESARAAGLGFEALLRSVVEAAESRPDATSRP